jgi:hypothetical protein
LSYVLRPKTNGWVSKHTKADSGTFDNDAKACFDRIIPALTQPPSQRASVRLPYACRIAAEGIMRRQDAETPAGMSDQSYSSNYEETLYGEGQGTKWATAAWLIITTLIIELMHKMADRL